MGDYDYFEKVTEPGKFVSHLENLIAGRTTLIDTQILPSLEPHLKKSGKKYEELIKSHNSFLSSFNQWLKDYPSSLVLVPGAREEIQHRLEAGGYYARQSLRAKGSLAALEEYEILIDQILAGIQALPRFEFPLFYNENLALLEYLHTVMQWQKDDHQAGNADDQIVSTALSLAIVKSTPINVVTFDRHLQDTLRSFHKITTCRQTAGSNPRPYVFALRKSEITVRGFNQDSGLIVFRGSTNQFLAPYSYPFEKEMKQIGRVGFKDAARAYNREKERIKKNIEGYLSTCHERFLGLQRERERVKTAPTEIKATEPAKKTIPSLMQSLESLLLLIPSEPETAEEIAKAREGYSSLKNISSQPGFKEFQAKIEERLTGLEKIEKELRKEAIKKEIDSKKKMMGELSLALDSEDSTENLIRIGEEIKTLYQTLKGLE